mgnify:CR=1 FL=1
MQRVSVALLRMQHYRAGCALRQWQEANAEAARSLKDQIQALPAEKAAQFLNLKSSSSITFSERDLKTLRKENCFNEMKIFQSNRIERFKIDVQRNCGDLFLVLSLINHSCAPNVDECYLPEESEDQETVEGFELRAVRDISKGEEMTIFYLSGATSMFLNQHGRQIYLKEQFGFNCKCGVCCGDVDHQDSIKEKIHPIFLSPDCELILEAASLFSL